MLLDHLLGAEGVAILGASEARHYARSVFKNLLLLGYPRDRIFPVNPKYRAVFGLRCYPSMAALPAPVPLVVVATHRDTVAGLVSDAASMGARAAVVLADGFAEQGMEGRKLQDELAAFCIERSLALLGPNTLGFVSPSSGLGVWAGGELAPLRPGGVALVSQSSGTLNLLLGLAGHRHIGLQSAVSVGNEAVLDAAHFIDHFAEDAKVTAIAVFLETTARPAALARALRKAYGAGKAVIMLKVGRSDRARRNVVAHTGRLASSGPAWEALLERLGVVLVEDLDELVQTVSLFANRRPLSGQGGLGICTISGGDCSLLSDLCERLAIPLPDVGPLTHDKLVAALEKPTLLGNPLDCENLQREDQQRFEASIDAFCQDPVFDVVAYRMNLEAGPTDALRALYRDLVRRARGAGKMPVVLTRAAEPLDSAWFRFFVDDQVAFLPSYRTALAAIGHLLRWARATQERAPLPFPSAVPEHMDAAHGSVSTLPWTATRQWLREAGIPCAPARLAQTPQEAADLAMEIGFPVAAKLVSPALPHKSEANAVRLHLATSHQVVEACRAMAAELPKRHPDAVLEGFELQTMMSGGIEMFLGMTRDEAVGPVLLVGVGGVWAEIVRDVLLAVPPVDHADCLALLRRLRVAPLLEGYRGSPPADVPALADLMATFSRFVVQRQDELQEMDLNPVVVLPEGKGAFALDALVRVRMA